MHYLTQHYKNRCAQLQEQVNVLSGYLRYISEAGIPAPINPPEAAGYSAPPTYSGAELANILNQFFDSNNRHSAPANLAAYMSAWRAQSGAENPNLPIPEPMNFRSSTAGRSVANAARGIMAAADGAGSMGGGYGVAGSAGGGAPRGYGKPSVGISRENVSSAPYSNSGFGVGGYAGGPATTNVPGDFNGDGRVDGADLGLALGGAGDFQSVLQNWSGSNPPASAGRFGVTPSGRRRR